VLFSSHCHRNSICESQICDAQQQVSLRQVFGLRVLRESLLQEGCRGGLSDGLRQQQQQQQVELRQVFGLHVLRESLVQGCRGGLSEGLRQLYCLGLEQG
jgi:hypothetical protein